MTRSTLRRSLARARRGLAVLLVALVLMGTPPGGQSGSDSQSQGENQGAQPGTHSQSQGDSHRVTPLVNWNS